MEKRIKLHEIFIGILSTKGQKESRVYFQPPESLKLQYPCIVYRLNSGDTQFADNNPYIFEKRYQAIAIDKNPDSDIPDKLARLPRCVLDRVYTADNLNHYAFNLYY